MRLDKAVLERFTEDPRSRSQWKKLIVDGLVKVDGVVEIDPNRTVNETHEITLSPIPEAAANDLPEPKLLYQDDDVVVFDKPSGMLTHAKGGYLAEKTLADYAAPFIQDPSGSNRDGIVHRLDRGTSGIIIVARNGEASRWLQAQFAKRNVKKTYVAVCDGVPKQQAALIDVPIERNPKAPSQFRAGASGKSAQTTYEVIKMNARQSLVEFKPRTGRTHQIRVHAAYINCPIAGDVVYGNASTAERLMLHAAFLELTLPNRERMTFNAPVPADFTV